MTAQPDPSVLPRGPFAEAECGAVLAAVASAFRCSVADLTGPRRGASVVQARNAAAWVLRRRPRPGGRQRSLPALCRTLNRENHSTVIHMIDRAEALAAEDAAYRAVLCRLAGEAFPIGRYDRAAVLLGVDAPQPVAPARLSLDEATQTALARSVSRRGERICADDGDARRRAAASIRLARAIARARGVAA